MRALLALLLLRVAGAHAPGRAAGRGQGLLLIWPQITGLIAGMIVVFAAAYVVFQREEVRA